MNKKISLGAAIAFSLIVAMAVFSITLPISQNITNRSLDALNEREAQYEKFSEIDREIRQRYYGEIDETKLQDSISSGYLTGIGDPKAIYYSAEEYAALAKDVTQDIGSLGIEAVISGESELVVEKVLNESPADIREILPGDIITKIDDIEVTSENIESMTAKLIGAEGSSVNLNIRRGGEEIFHDLVRRVIAIPTIEWEMIENTTVAYLIISNFDETTGNQFARILTEAQNMGGTSMIIDLRNNESYEIEHAYRIMDRILPAGPIVTAKYNDGRIQEFEQSDPTQLTWPMAVIANDGTIGVGEVFAQALKDAKKASIVGVPTAGRGVRLETIPLRDGSAIQLTVAKYETISGTNLDGEGVVPDFEVTLSGVLGTDWKNLTIQTDTQLSKAIEAVSSK